MQGTANNYLMEHKDEADRLDIKTDPKAVWAQAQLCGIGPGATVLDVGCGSGKAASVLKEIVCATGEVVGVDYSATRIAYACEHYGHSENLRFQVADFTQPMGDLGEFDFIWVRFVLEYFSREAYEIIVNLTHHLKPDGRLCLLDLDHNSLNHFPLPIEMERVMKAAMEYVSAKHNFDPYAGRKLYSHLYDLAYRDIRIHMVAHHLLYGKLRQNEAYDWERKVGMWINLAYEIFETYPGGTAGFTQDFVTIANDPRRFTYTPMIICTGMKPSTY